MALLYKELGIDLGTVNTIISEGGQIVLSEPTMVVIDVDEQKVVEVGEQARHMFGRVPEGYEVCHPMQDGAIADFEVAQVLLTWFIRKVSGAVSPFKPRAKPSCAPAAGRFSWSRGPWPPPWAPGCRSPRRPGTWWCTWAGA
jgi:rod shape-determining protein MreB